MTKLTKAIISATAVATLLLGLASNEAQGASDSGTSVTSPPRSGGPVRHCVQNPDNNCSNKKFYCDVRRENLEHPDSDTSDGHGNRVCCWSHYHP